MPRIIIDYEDNIDPTAAMALVSDVIREGLVSECSTGAHYYWITRFRSLGKPIIVATRRRRQGQESDSFRVFVDREEGEDGDNACVATDH